MPKDTNSQTPVLTKIALRAGLWQGRLHGAGEEPPDLVAQLRGEVVARLDATPADSPGTWTVELRIPPQAVGEGAQTLVISDAASQTALGGVTILAGDRAQDDLHAEVDLLRAELDLLKRAFRRHCLDTGAG